MKTLLLLMSAATLAASSFGQTRTLTVNPTTSRVAYPASFWLSNVVDSATIDFSVDGLGRLTASAIIPTNSGAVVSVDGTVQASLNIADNTIITVTQTGTNTQFDIALNSFPTNRFDATALSWIRWHAITNALAAGSNVTFTYDTGTQKITVAAANGLTDGDKGDVTVSASGATFTIDSSTITSAKIVDGTIVAGDIADSTITTGKILDGTLLTNDFAAATMSAITFDAEAALTYQPLDADLTTLATLNGAALTNLNGSEIRTGTVADARIDAAIMRDAEAAAAFEPLRSTVSQAEAEAGTATTVRAWTAERVAQAIAALAPSGGSSVVILTNGITGNPIVLHDNLSMGPTNTITVTNLNVTGTLTITAGLSGSIITSGTVADARIDAAILRDAEAAALYQPLDSDLTAVAGMSANGIVARTGTGTVSARTITGTANEVTVTNGDGVSGNPTLSLASTLTLTGKTITIPTEAAGTSNAAPASTTFVERAIQMAGTNTLQVASLVICDPDGAQAISDAFPILAVESSWAPNGVTVRNVYLKTDAASTYAVNFEEWTSPTDGSPSTIEAVSTSSSTEAEDDGTLSDATVAAGSIIFVDLPTTTANWIQVTVTYYVK